MTQFYEIINDRDTVYRMRLLLREKDKDLRNGIKETIIDKILSEYDLNDFEKYCFCFESREEAEELTLTTYRNGRTFEFVVNAWYWFEDQIVTKKKLIIS